MKVPAVEDKLQIVYVPVNQLKPYKGNPRKINEKGIAKLQRSVEEFGFVNPILAQRGTNMIIAGHQRLKAAQAAGLAEVPVVWLDMDDVTAKAYNIVDNRLQDEAEWDFTPQADLLTELDTGAFDLTLTGFDTDELERMMNYTPVGEVQEDEAPEPPAEAVTKPGDIWQLGKHRVMCGDSAKAGDVERLMAGEQAALVVTDPPYGVSYADKNVFLNAYDKGNRVQTEMANDHADKEATQKMWREAFANMGASMRPGAVVYCFMPQGGDQMMMMMMMMMSAGIEPRHELIWVKNNHVLGRVDYAYKHEPIMYAWKPGGHKFYGGFQTSLLEFARPSKSDLHPTMKPIPLIARLMENSSLRDETVYDPFLGSGTTLIAAEQLGRTCYGMEIDPHYCDMIVKRWEQLTGKKAELVR